MRSMLSMLHTALPFSFVVCANRLDKAIVAKTTEPHPKLPGTIFTAKEDMEKAGGRAIAIKCMQNEAKQNPQIL